MDISTKKVVFKHNNLSKRHFFTSQKLIQITKFDIIITDIA